MKYTKSEEISKNLPKEFINRTIHTELMQSITSERPDVVVLYGARQVGKTSEIEKCMYDILHTNESNIVFYFNLDYAKLTDSEDFRDPERFISLIRSQLNPIERTQKVFIFLDEAQRLDQIGLFIKYLYDMKLGWKFILTGSASLTIKRKVKEPLTGRKQEFTLYPLDSNEFFQYHGLWLNGVSNTDNMEKLLEDYLVYGGYPGVVTLNHAREKVDKLNSIKEDYLYKDIPDLFGISDRNQITKVMTYLATGLGSIFSLDALTRSVGGSQYTNQKILTILEETFMTHRLVPFYRNRTKELIHHPKIYFTDIGIRNSLLNRLSSNLLIGDKGGIFENLIANLLKIKYRESKVKFWRNINQTEVDFVVEESYDRLKAFESKYDWDNNKVPKSLRSFLNNYDGKVEKWGVYSRSNFWEIF